MDAQWRYITLLLITAFMTPPRRILIHAKDATGICAIAFEVHSDATPLCPVQPATGDSLSPTRSVGRLKTCICAEISSLLPRALLCEKRETCVFDPDMFYWVPTSPAAYESKELALASPHGNDSSDRAGNLCSARERLVPECFLNGADIR